MHGEPLTRSLLPEGLEITGLDNIPAPFTSHQDAVLDRMHLKKCLAVYDFQHIVGHLREGSSATSPQAALSGAQGYHAG